MSEEMRPKEKDNQPSGKTVNFPARAPVRACGFALDERPARSAAVGPHRRHLTHFLAITLCRLAHFLSIHPWETGVALSCDRIIAICSFHADHHTPDRKTSHESGLAYRANRTRIGHAVMRFGQLALRGSSSPGSVCDGSLPGSPVEVSPPWFA